MEFLAFFVILLIIGAVVFALSARRRSATGGIPRGEPRSRAPED